MNYKENKTNKSIAPLISVLFHATTQSHIYHLQTDSYAQHKAVQKVYEELPDLIDSIVEAYQCEGTPVMGYKAMPYLEDSNPLQYFENVYNQVQMLRYECCSAEDTPIQNEIDNVCLLFKRTKYKLKRLV
jgi:DNA-binding ferritin-like protein